MRGGARWKPAAGRSRARTKRCESPHAKFSLSVCVVCVGFLILLGGCARYLPATPEASPMARVQPVTLLVWTHPFGSYRSLPDCLELYGVPGCTLTDDESSYPQADAVLVHHREVATGDAELPPEPRPPGQKWIWLNYESPTHTHGLWRLEGLFNLTMSYRRDSSIFLPYGYLVPAGPQQLLHRPSRRRDRFVAWVVSNWSSRHARAGFFLQLRRYVRVDVFGRAGQPLARGRDSVVRLLGRYMFYLALENSQHTDYITEKLWNAIRAGAVPVVLGPPRHNYERFLPREAFIHVDDFPSVKALARYLQLLRRNPARMRRHLDWKRSYSLHEPAFWGEHYCTACRAVSRSKGQSERVEHLRDWFHS